MLVDEHFQNSLVAYFNKREPLSEHNEVVIGIKGVGLIALCLEVIFEQLQGGPGFVRQGVIAPYQRIKLRQRGRKGDTPHKCLN